MTRGEASKLLNNLLEQVNFLEKQLRPLIFLGRPQHRLDIIRDQVMLLALDLKLPLQPEGNDDSGEPRGPGGDSDSQTSTG